MAAPIDVYARVSTTDQSLRRQITGTADYIEHEFDQAPDDIPGEAIADVAEDRDTTGGDPFVVADAERDVCFYWDKSTGTDTERAGYRAVMDHAASGEAHALVAHGVTRISRSSRDLDAAAERIVDAGGAQLHAVSDRLVLTNEDNPAQRAMFQMLGVFAELEAKWKQMRAKEGIAAALTDDDHHHGRPPLGFESEDGRLYETEDYMLIVNALRMADRGDLSKRKAAELCDTSRPSITRALEERRELYGLDEEPTADPADLIMDEADVSAGDRREMGDVLDELADRQWSDG